QEVERLLQRVQALLTRQLDELQGRVELGLMVLWERDHLFAEIVEENPSIRALRDQIGGLPPDKGHYERIRLGELTSEGMEHKREQEAAAVLDRLSPLAEATVTNRLHIDMMILNGAFLVERAQVERFAQEVAKLTESQAGRLVLRYAGPLPPYNFVTVALH